MTKKISVLLMGLISFSVVNAQTKKVLADKIIAQVGDKIILRSDVVNALADMKRQAQQQNQENIQLPTECQILEGQMTQKALYLQALKDSLPLTDEELEGILDNRIRSFIQSYGSKEMLEEIAGKTIYQLKEEFKEPIREQKLAQQMQDKILENIKITPNEVKAFYNAIPKDSLPFYESELEISQLIVHPKANKDVEEYISKQLYDIKKQIEGGKKFEQMAKLYSEDPGSKDNGGQYQVNRTEKMFDPTFLAAAFRLKEGQISPVIKTKFGLHIIQMVSRAGDDALVRHILKIPPISDDEINESKHLLDSIRKLIVTNKITFGEAVNKNSDEENSKFNGGALAGQDGSTLVTIDQLDADMVLAIKDMKVGTISEPRVYTDERGRKLVRIITLKSRSDAHRANLKDDYNRISQMALAEKKQNALEKWFKVHIPNYFVEIDKEFMNCGGLEQWRKAQAAQSTR